MSQATEDLRADLSRARTWVLVNGPSADAAIVSAGILGEPVRVPDHTYEAATADFRCAMRDAITDKRLSELRHG